MSDPRGRAILLVDDDPVIRNGYGQRLASQGFDVRTAADGYEAVQAAQEEHFDLILLDLRMPYRNGAEVLRLLRAAPRTSRTRVYLLAQHGDADLVELAMREGADGVFEKSELSPRDIAIEVSALLDPGGADQMRAARPRGVANVPAAVDQIARRFRQGSNAPAGTPDRAPASRYRQPAAPQAGPDGPRDAVEMYRRQEQLRTRSESEVRALTQNRSVVRHAPRGAPGTTDHGAPPPRGATAYDAPTASAPPPGAAIDGAQYDTVLNRFMGQASRLAADLGLPPDLTCPICGGQIVLRLWPDPGIEVGVRGHFHCPRCTGR